MLPPSQHLQIKVRSLTYTVKYIMPSTESLHFLYHLNCVTPYFYVNQLWFPFQLKPKFIPATSAVVQMLHIPVLEGDKVWCVHIIIILAGIVSNRTVFIQFIRTNVYIQQRANINPTFIRFITETGHSWPCKNIYAVL